MIPVGKFYRGNILVLVAVISVLSLGALYVLYLKLEETRQETRQEYLEQNLQKAVIEFEKGIEKYAVLVSGLRSHVLGLNRIPSAPEIQNYVLHHLELMEYGNSIIINYIDSDHTFLFSVSEGNLAPNDLVGVNLNDIRPEETVIRMEFLLQSEGLVSFPPINMYEGFVGFPIDFRLVIEEEVVGYMTPLIDIRNLLDPIIAIDVNEEFTYRFSYGEDILFDREKVYNGTDVHHSRIDSANLHLEKASYIIEDIECYNLLFSIGIAYRNETETSRFFPFVQTSFTVILLLILISMLLFYFFLQNLSKAKNLRESNKELSFMNAFLKKFIYASSHDLKQPLVNIDNFQGLLKRKYGESIDATGHKYFDVISNNIGHMHLILEDLLIYSKIVKGGIEKESIDLNVVLNEIAETYPSNQIQIHYVSLPKIVGSKSEIQRLFQNLISNAIKFNDNEIAKVEITFAKKNEMLEIRVKDNGIGISEAHLPLVFEEFQQVNKYKYKGTGLGLSICKEIVRNHGGTIWAESNDQGGTDFIFQLRQHD